MLLNYAGKDENNLEIGVKNKVIEKETEFQNQPQNSQEKSKGVTSEGCEPRKLDFSNI